MRNTLISLLLISGIIHFASCNEAPQQSLSAPTSGNASDKIDTNVLGLSDIQLVELFDFGQSGLRKFEFSPKSRSLFVSFHDKNGLVHEWNVDNQQIEHVYKLRTGYLCDELRASPDGDVLIVGCWPLEGYTCQTLVINTASKSISAQLPISGRVSDIAFDGAGESFRIIDSNSGTKGLAFLRSGETLLSFDASEFESKNGRAWTVESSKSTIQTHGLYCTDPNGKEHLLTQNNWHQNYAVTKDGRFVATTTWDGELIVWRRKDQKQVFHQKMADQYGFLQYDPKFNRFLWADATTGSSKLMALQMPSEH